MLHFLYGRASSGKSYTMMNSVHDDITNGKDVIILVPEQFTFDTEKTVVRQFGDHATNCVTVLSFTRLCDEMERIVGGGCEKILTPAGKQILMSRALRMVADRMKIWGKQSRSVEFCDTVLHSIDEFKAEGISPDDLKQAVEAVSKQRLSAKLHDIALIYDCYNGLITQYYIDPIDRLTKLYNSLETHRFFEGKTVYVDSFKGFSGQQYRVLERILTQADDVSVALTVDPYSGTKYDLFENVRKTAGRLKKIADSHRIPISENALNEKNPMLSEDLVAVEQILSGTVPDNHFVGKDVTVCAAQTVYDEAEFAARTIRRLVRQNGYRYRDFVVIARDLSTYEEAFSAACEKNAVRCFIDRRVPLIHFPPVVAVLSAFSVAERFTTESVLRFHKSGIGVLTVEELSILERYCRLWNIDGKQWLTEWTMNPSGLKPECGDLNVNLLAEINRLRVNAITPLQNFKKQFTGTAIQRGTAIMNLFADTNAADAYKHLQNCFIESGDHAQADALAQVYNMMVEILEDLANCFGNEEPDFAAYTKAFMIAVSRTTVGVAPQAPDEVSFGAADRIRPARPKIAIILGCNQGVFPKPAEATGLFGIGERAEMIDIGFEISDCAVEKAIDENFLVYSNLCCATDQLFLTYALQNAEQEEINPSPFVGQIVEILRLNPVFEPQLLNSSTALPETADAAFSVACAQMEDHPEWAQAVLKLLPDSLFRERSTLLLESLKDVPKKLSTESAKTLYGNRLRFSATAIEVYHSCQFRYFCKYGLKAQKIQPADFDALQRGTMIHFILQRIFETYRDTIGNLTDKTINESVDSSVREYLAMIPGFHEICTPHLDLIVENMARAAKEVVAQLRNEFAQSDFKPAAFEFKFGMEGKPPVTVPYNDGQITLHGSVDRVDIWNGYVRIIDYKTGKKEFRLPDILVGQNLQMLLYLYAITRDGTFKNYRNAGIFYVPAHRDQNNNGLTMDGLMSADEDLVHAMEKNNAGEFIPQYRLKKDGTLFSSAEKNFVKEEDFSAIFDYIEHLLQKTADDIYAGNIAVEPIDGVKTDACKYCDFAGICGIEDRPHKKAEAFTNADVIAKIKTESGEVANG